MSTNIDGRERQSIANKLALSLTLRMLADEDVQRNGDPYGLHIEPPNQLFVRSDLSSTKCHVPQIYTPCFSLRKRTPLTDLWAAFDNGSFWRFWQALWPWI